MNKLGILLAFILVAGSLHGENLRNLKTGSMPCFQGDDWLEMQSTPFFSLNVGDVICYRPSEVKLAALHKYVELSPWAAVMYEVFEGNTNTACHRIVYADGWSVIVKADVSRTPDPFRLEPRDYRGQVMNGKCKQKLED